MQGKLKSILRTFSYHGFSRSPKLRGRHRGGNQPARDWHSEQGKELTWKSLWPLWGCMTVVLVIFIWCLSWLLSIWYHRLNIHLVCILNIWLLTFSTETKPSTSTTKSVLLSNCDYQLLLQTKAQISTALPIRSSNSFLHGNEDNPLMIT